MKKALRKLFRRRSEPTLRVLMVCSGNICRSPTAEAVLRAKLAEASLDGAVEVDSAGTHGFHFKEPPDARAQQCAKRRGYDLSALRARSVGIDDFSRFDWILAMDEGHLEWLRRSAPSTTTARISLLMDHAARSPRVREVPDPYYGPEGGFEQVLDLVEEACEGVVRSLREQLRAGDPTDARVSQAKLD